MRVIKWMLKMEPNKRPNVEDLLNLPHVSMKLRERALKKNISHMKKTEEEVKKKEKQLKEKEEELDRREKELAEKERQIEELERAVQEMQALKKNSGSSTTCNTDLANDSCINPRNQNLSNNSGS